MADLFYSSIFGDLVKNTQVRIDAASKLNKQIFDSVIFEKYLDWDTPTIGLDFQELAGKYNISVAAPTIGIDSKEPILSPEGAEYIKERILRHAITKPMTIQDYRKILQILDSKSITDSAKAQQLVNLMWGEVSDVVNSVNAKLDFIFLKALSNEGSATLDATNNPESGVHGSISFNQPAGNIATSTTAWTAGNIATVDCFEDIQGILDTAADKVVFSKILLDPALISYMCRTTQLKKMVWGSDKAASILTLRDLNEYMQANGYPVFEAIRRQVRVQNADGTKTVVKPWTTANMVFVPEGKLGVVKNAYANNELKPENGVAYSNYGRIRVSQWGVGETQNSNGVEFTKAEAMALPVITEMDGIYTLKTQYQ